jgi:hypothetical protein
LAARRGAGGAAIVMELVDGVSLHEMSARAGPKLHAA